MKDWAREQIDALTLQMKILVREVLHRRDADNVAREGVVFTARRTMCIGKTIAPPSKKMARFAALRQLLRASKNFDVSPFNTVNTISSQMCQVQLLFGEGHRNSYRRHLIDGVDDTLRNDPSTSLATS